MLPQEDRLARIAAALLLLAGAARASDPPIAADARLSLDGPLWTATPASDPGSAIAATVPGDLISDIAASGAVANPWLDLTWRAEAARWDLESWAYSTRFATPAGWAAGAGAETWLVLDSVKMAADVALNGRALGAATSQHLRYAIAASGALAAPGADNELTLTFAPTTQDARNDAGRYMGCSGGWDWAPYSNETVGRTPKGIRTFSKGVAGSVYLAHTAAPAAGGAGAAITAVKPLVFYAGAYAAQPLTDASAGPWRVDVVVYLLSPAGAAGTITVEAEWAPGAPATADVSLAAGAETAVNVSLSVPAGSVSLWWPNAVARASPGGRRLYAVTASFSPAGSAASVAASRRVGFRALALATADDSDPGALSGVPGSGNLTMRFKVNGADLFARGANWIPLEELEGRNLDAAHAAAVASAAAANFNVLRVWGGKYAIPEPSRPPARPPNQP
jgi:hypothetical protein